MKFVLRSEDIEDDRAIPRAYTCDGGDRSPALEWSGAPPSTQAFALVVHDPDAPSGDWTHWVVFDLPKTTHALPAGISGAAHVDGGAQGKNDFGKIGWGGPCPPPGREHRYFFDLYALDQPLGLPPGSPREKVERAMKGHVLGQTSLVGRYARQRS